MEKINTIEFALYTLYNENEVSYPDFVSLLEYKDKTSLFVRYVETQLTRFIEIVKSIDKNVLINALEEFNDFKGHKSKCRFINLLKKISDDFLKVLKECYIPNQAQASKDLETLLGTKNKRIQPYLVEQLINYCSIDYEKDKTLYRIRDCKIGEQIDNCWHTPYNIRQKSYSGRFSNPGFPCLYLADSPKTCCAEVGDLQEGYARWLGTFKLNKNQLLRCLDLTIPNIETIKNANPYERIQFILTYPLRLLCTTYAVHKSDTFGEEYLFSQVLMNLLNHPLDENSGMCRVVGVAYNSTKNPEGVNYALPAKSLVTPPNLDEKYSQYLQNMFHLDKLSIIDNNESLKG